MFRPQPSDDEDDDDDYEHDDDDDDDDDDEDEDYSVMLNLIFGVLAPALSTPQGALIGSTVENNQTTFAFRWLWWGS